MVLLKILFLVNFIFCCVSFTDAQAPPWNYMDTTDWATDYPQCNGLRQSPIALEASTAMYVENYPPLRFIHYDELLADPKTLVNNGKTVNFAIPLTINGFRPFIRQSMFGDKYEAISLHFHWGSRGVPGSEHTINGRRFDVEMHIVHRNAKYPNQSVALENADGLIVLGVMLQGVQRTDAFYPGFEQIFNRLPDLVTQNSTQIRGNLFLGQLLGDLRSKSFFTYNGSLTTPNCAEAVIWYVFAEPLNVPYFQIERFFNLYDFSGQPLINNYRPLQARNGRPVYYRTSETSQNPLVFPYLRLCKKRSELNEILSGQYNTKHRYPVRC